MEFLTTKSAEFSSNCPVLCKDGEKYHIYIYLRKHWNTEKMLGFETNSYYQV